MWHQTYMHRASYGGANKMRRMAYIGVYEKPTRGF